MAGGCGWIRSESRTARSGAGGNRGVEGARCRLGGASGQGPRQRDHMAERRGWKARCEEATGQQGVVRLLSGVTCATRLSRRVATGQVALRRLLEGAEGPAWAERGNQGSRTVGSQPAVERAPSNKGMKLTKLSAAPTLAPQAALGRRCRLMPAPAWLDAGTASQLIPGVRRTLGGPARAAECAG